MSDSAEDGQVKGMVVERKEQISPATSKTKNVEDETKTIPDDSTISPGGKNISEKISPISDSKGSDNEDKDTVQETDDDDLVMAMDNDITSRGIQDVMKVSEEGDGNEVEKVDVDVDMDKNVGRDIAKNSAVRSKRYSSVEGKDDTVNALTLASTRTASNEDISSEMSGTSSRGSNRTDQDEKDVEPSDAIGKTIDIADEIKVVKVEGTGLREGDWNNKDSKSEDAHSDVEMKSQDESPAESAVGSGNTTTTTVKDVTDKGKVIENECEEDRKKEEKSEPENGDDANVSGHEIDDAGVANVNVDGKPESNVNMISKTVDVAKDEAMIEKVKYKIVDEKGKRAVKECGKSEKQKSKTASKGKNIGKAPTPIPLVRAPTPTPTPITIGPAPVPITLAVKPSTSGSVSGNTTSRQTSSHPPPPAPTPIPIPWPASGLQTPSIPSLEGAVSPESVKYGLVSDKVMKGMAKDIKVLRSRMYCLVDEYCTTQLKRLEEEEKRMSDGWRKLQKARSEITAQLKSMAQKGDTSWSKWDDAMSEIITPGITPRNQSPLFTTTALSRNTCSMMETFPQRVSSDPSVSASVSGKASNHTPPPPPDPLMFPINETEKTSGKATTGFSAPPALALSTSGEEQGSRANNGHGCKTGRVFSSQAGSGVQGSGVQKTLGQDGDFESGGRDGERAREKESGAMNIHIADEDAAFNPFNPQTSILSRSSTSTSAQLRNTSTCAQDLSNLNDLQNVMENARTHPHMHGQPYPPDDPNADPDVDEDGGVGGRNRGGGTIRKPQLSLRDAHPRARVSRRMSEFDSAMDAESSVVSASQAEREKFGPTTGDVRTRPRGGMNVVSADSSPFLPGGVSWSAGEDDYFARAGQGRGNHAATKRLHTSMVDEDVRIVGAGGSERGIARTGVGSYGSNMASHPNPNLPLHVQRERGGDLRSGGPNARFPVPQSNNSKRVRRSPNMSASRTLSTHPSGNNIESKEWAEPLEGREDPDERLTGGTGASEGAGMGRQGGTGKEGQIKLRVGSESGYRDFSCPNHLFFTFPDSGLKSVVHGERDAEGFIRLNREPDAFLVVLAYLKSNGQMPPLPSDPNQRTMIWKEFKFWNIPLSKKDTSLILNQGGHIIYPEEEKQKKGSPALSPLSKRRNGTSGRGPHAGEHFPKPFYNRQQQHHESSKHIQSQIQSLGHASDSVYGTGGGSGLTPQASQGHMYKNQEIVTQSQRHGGYEQSQQGQNSNPSYQQQIEGANRMRVLYERDNAYMPVSGSGSEGPNSGGTAKEERKHAFTPETYINTNRDTSRLSERDGHMDRGAGGGDRVSMMDWGLEREREGASVGSAINSRMEMRTGGPMYDDEVQIMHDRERAISVRDRDIEREMAMREREWAGSRDGVHSHSNTGRGRSTKGEREGRDRERYLNHVQDIVHDAEDTRGADWDTRSYHSTSGRSNSFMATSQPRLNNYGSVGVGQMSMNRGLGDGEDGRRSSKSPSSMRVDSRGRQREIDGVADIGGGRGGSARTSQYMDEYVAAGGSVKTSVGLKDASGIYDAAVGKPDVCENCRTEDTPTWRVCDGVKLCNACGLYYTQHENHHRPSRLFRTSGSGGSARDREH
eukprot:CFRG7535T1